MWLALVLVIVGAAPPDGILVEPALVELSAARPYADVTVQNVGTAPRDVRAEAFSWEQDAAGRVTLAPTGAAGMFPPRAVIAHGEKRRFRLSVDVSAPVRETAFRVALHVRDLASGGAVTALVPAFFAPAHPSVAATLRAECGASGCRVVLVNEGTVRIRPQRIELAVLGPEGVESVRELEPWWVLAGGTRVWEVPLAAAAPERDIRVEVALGGERLAATAPLR